MRLRRAASVAAGLAASCALSGLLPAGLVGPAHAVEPAATVGLPLAPALEPGEIKRQLASGTRHGLLFEARRGDARIVLFGTAHIGRPDVFPLDAVAFEALKSSDAVAVELDIRKAESDGPAMIERSRLPDGQTLQAITTPEQWTRIEAALKNRGALSDAVRTSEPWIATSTLIMAEAGRRGETMQTGADLMTIAFAQAFRKPVVELESAALQADALGAASLPSQVEALMYTIDQLESGSGDTMLLGVVDAWVAGDLDRLSAYRKRLRDDPREGGADVYKALLLDREAGMLDRLEQVRAQYGTVFVAIGALHLAGDDSLRARLERAGWTIRRL